MVIGCHRHPQDITSTPDFGHATLPALPLRVCQIYPNMPMRLAFHCAWHCIILYRWWEGMPFDAIWFTFWTSCFILGGFMLDGGRWPDSRHFESQQPWSILPSLSKAAPRLLTFMQHTKYEMWGTFTWLSLGKWIQGDAVVTLNFTWWHLRMYFNVL